MLPHTVPLEASPSWPLSLGYPPRVRWFGLARHGHLPVEHYCFPGLWSLHLYRWTGVLEIAGIALPVQPGYASLIPLGEPIAHHFIGPSVHLTAGFEPGVAGSPAGTITLPAMQDLGDDFAPFWGALDRGVAVHAPDSPRTTALVWEILWRLAERAPQSPSVSPAARHPAVVSACQIIELRLGEPLRVAELAAAVDLSHNHLTRLFQSAFGKSVSEYLRERRVTRARQLLQHSTVPIKTVAAQVGLPDLHQFNKVIRAATGVSPRSLRSRTGPE